MIEFLSVAGLRTDPRAYGKNPSTTFNPVVPSLPGFADAACLLGPTARIRERLGLRQDSPATTLLVTGPELRAIRDAAPG